MSPPPSSSSSPSSSQYFTITSHTIPGQHIREYPTGLRGRQEQVVRVAVKRYVPFYWRRRRRQGQPQGRQQEQEDNEFDSGAEVESKEQDEDEDEDEDYENAVTIIGTHGNGFPKELYEPYFQRICISLESRGVRVRGIWMADSSHQGESGVLNEDILGDSPSWFDHSRDLLQMVNTFRSEMPRPIIGIAHSFGCAQLIQLSTMHPRLLSAMIICEPVILSSRKSASGPNPGTLSAIRRDLWPNRADAEARLSRAFKSWNPEVRSLYLQHGLRRVPTSLYNPAQDSAIPADAVTLTTSKHQETFTFVNFNFSARNEEQDWFWRPDQDPDIELPYLAARPEASAAFRMLPHVRPDVCFVFGEKSPLSPPRERDIKVKTTGTGVGGSGGTKTGRVKGIVIPEAGHLLPFESKQLESYAQVSTEWLDEWYVRWKGDEKRRSANKYRGSDESLQRMSSEFLAGIKLPMSEKRPFVSEEEEKKSESKPKL